MAPAIVSVIAFFVLIAWRFVLAGPHHRLLARAIAPQRQRHNHLLEEGLQISDPGSVAVIAESQFENNSGGLHFRPKGSRKNRSAAHRCPHRCHAIGNAYDLDVGKMRFRVRDRNISRLRDMTDPGCALEETCFYSVHRGMPKVEEIATALLQLANNPALLDRWAAQSGASKADSQPFSPAQ
jgi:hypothetical protein